MLYRPHYTACICWRTAVCNSQRFVVTAEFCLLSTQWFCTFHSLTLPHNEAPFAGAMFEPNTTVRFWSRLYLQCSRTARSVLCYWQTVCLYDNIWASIAYICVFGTWYVYVGNADTQIVYTTCADLIYRWRLFTIYSYNNRPTQIKETSVLYYVLTHYTFWHHFTLCTYLFCDVSISVCVSPACLPAWHRPTSSCPYPCTDDAILRTARTVQTVPSVLQYNRSASYRVTTNLVAQSAVTFRWWISWHCLQKMGPG